MNESKQAAQNIDAILKANITIHGVNVSELLTSQRERIIQLHAKIDNLNAETKRITCANRDLAARVVKQQQVAPEPECEQGTDSGFNVSIKVSGDRPIPTEMKAMLADFEEMLRSVGGERRG